MACDTDLATVAPTGIRSNSGLPARRSDGDNTVMIRIREILDPDLKQQILTALAERRGCTVAAIPEWFELDDADYVDLLNALQHPEDETDRADFRQ